MRRLYSKVWKGGDFFWHHKNTRDNKISIVIVGRSQELGRNPFSDFYQRPFVIVRKRVLRVGGRKGVLKVGREGRLGRWFHQLQGSQVWKSGKYKKQGHNPSFCLMYFFCVCFTCVLLLITNCGNNEKKGGGGEGVHCEFGLVSTYQIFSAAFWPKSAPFWK